MEFIRLGSSEDPRFGPAMALYRKSFPTHEQRRGAAQKKALGNDAYHFDLIYDERDFVGILLYWETQTFFYIEHFCIDPDRRNQRYGQRALEQLCQRGKSVILEIDPPVDGLSMRRKAFYERVGFLENPFAHVHPPYREGYQGHPLVVMSSPDVLSQMEYGEFYTYLKETVMGDPA